MTEAAVSDPGALLEAIARETSEPDWLLEVRRSALRAYTEAPLPDRVAHLWRYTDPRKFVPADEAMSAALESVASARAQWPAAIRSGLKAGELSGAAFIDGSGSVLLEAGDELTEKGVVLIDLRHAAAERPDLVRERLASAVGSGHGKFEALNLAFWRNGIFLHVPRNAQVEKPLHLWFRAPEVSRQTFCSTRLLLVVEEGASVTVIDECAGGGAGLKLNSVAEVLAGPGSRVRHASVQRLGQGVSYHFTERARVAREADLLTLVATLGGGTTKADLGSLVEGPGAHINLLGFLFGGRRQHFDHHTVHDHKAGHTCSDLDFKVVLKDRARSAYTGLIRIEQDAPTCEAYQENRNLLLTDGCRAESIPELEILNEEVICTHGATVGSLDAQHIFYLMSRGIPRREAVRLIVGGFIEPTLARLPENLSSRLRGYVEKQLEDL